MSHLLSVLVWSGIALVVFVLTAFAAYRMKNPEPKTATDPKKVEAVKTPAKDHSSSHDGHGKPAWKEGLGFQYVIWSIIALLALWTVDATTFHVIDRLVGGVTGADRHQTVPPPPTHPCNIIAEQPCQASPPDVPATNDVASTTDQSSTQVAQDEVDSHEADDAIDCPADGKLRKLYSAGSKDSIIFNARRDGQVLHIKTSSGDITIRSVADPSNDTSGNDVSLTGDIDTIEVVNNNDTPITDLSCYFAPRAS